MIESEDQRILKPTYRVIAEPRLRLLIPLVIACGFFMENLDSTILATSIPQMAASFGENPKPPSQPDAHTPVSCSW